MNRVHAVNVSLAAHHRSVDDEKNKCDDIIIISIAFLIVVAAAVYIDCRGKEKCRNCGLNVWRGAATQIQQEVVGYERVEDIL